MQARWRTRIRTSLNNAGSLAPSQDVIKQRRLADVLVKITLVSGIIGARLNPIHCSDPSLVSRQWRRRISRAIDHRGTLASRPIWHDTDWCGIRTLSLNTIVDDPSLQLDLDWYNFNKYFKGNVIVHVNKIKCLHRCGINLREKLWELKHFFLNYDVIISNLLR